MVHEQNHTVFSAVNDKFELFNEKLDHQKSQTWLASWINFE